MTLHCLSFLCYIENYNVTYDCNGNYVCCSFIDSSNNFLPYTPCLAAVATSRSLLVLIFLLLNWLFCDNSHTLTSPHCCLPLLFIVCNLRHNVTRTPYYLHYIVPLYLYHFPYNISLSKRSNDCTNFCGSLTAPRHGSSRSPELLHSSFSCAKSLVCTWKLTWYKLDTNLIQTWNLLDTNSAHHLEHRTHLISFKDISHQ